MRVIIVGGGEVVYFLARTFLSKGYNVSIINDSSTECDSLSKRLKALIIKGDGSDPDFMEDAMAREAQILIAVTPYDHVNLVTCQTASLKYKIPRTMALVTDPDNYEIFKDLGVDHIFNQTDLIVSMIEKQVRFDHVVNLLEYGEGGVLINEVHITQKMPAAGMNAAELDLPEGAKIIGIVRNKEFHMKDDFTLEGGDLMLLLTRPNNHGATLRAICGKEA